MAKTTDFNYELDEYEQEIEEGLRKEGFKRIPNFKREMERYRAAAKATLAKNKNVNIRISEQDLSRIKSKAASQGVPYQTLLTSLIHQYSNNQIEYNVLREPKGKYVIKRHK